MDWMHEFPGDYLLHLASFRVLARFAGRQGAYADAATELGIDESVLRRRMSHLGDYTSSGLFEGQGSNRRLSRAGAGLVEVVDQILEAVERVPRGLMPEPRLVVGCTGSVAGELLPIALGAMKSAFPEAQACVRRLGSKACLDGVADGSVDIGIVRSQRKPKNLHAEALGPDRLWVALPVTTLLARRSSISTQELATSPQVTYGPTSATRARVMRVLEPLGAEIAVEVDGKSTALAYVGAGLGIAFLSALGKKPPKTRRGVVLRDVTQLFAPVRFWLVYRKARRLARWETTFLDALRKVSGSAA
ncbi:MAG TPA: LysR substrate-binding domain-containing protein [Polyangiaceae bacterium]